MPTRFLREDFAFQTSGANAVASGAQSAHFAAVNGHLDLGGSLYGYMDIDGDVEKIAGMVQGFLDTAKQQAGDDMPPHLKNLNVAQVLEELGLSGIEALGMSSYKDRKRISNSSAPSAM